MNVWQQVVDNALVSAHLGVAGEVTADEAEKILNEEALKDEAPRSNVTGAYFLQEADQHMQLDSLKKQLKGVNHE